MLFKKLTLEEILSSFTVAKDNYFAQKAILETIERNYDEVKRNYYMYKHYYEAALAECARFGGRVYSEREMEARHKYAIAAQNYRNEESKLCNQQWVFKKAHKTYKKLRRLLEKKEEQEKNQPQ
ncbi:MAG: hypothetical protein J6J33_01390 [Clostridia bacterium]|nr:hypothetical protein [Clostridia bacterium]